MAFCRQQYVSQNEKLSKHLHFSPRRCRHSSSAVEYQPEQNVRDMLFLEGISERG